MFRRRSCSVARKENSIDLEFDTLTNSWRRWPLVVNFVVLVTVVMFAVAVAVFVIDSSVTHSSFVGWRSLAR